MKGPRFAAAAMASAAALMSACVSIGDALIEAAVDAAFDSALHTSEQRRTHSDWAASAARERSTSSFGERALSHSGAGQR
jgi:hypothetical protein